MSNISKVRLNDSSLEIEDYNNLVRVCYPNDAEIGEVYIYYRESFPVSTAYLKEAVHLEMSYKIWLKLTVAKNYLYKEFTVHPVKLIMNLSNFSLILRKYLWI